MTPATRLKIALIGILCLCLPSMAAGQTIIDFDTLSCGSPLVVTTEYSGLLPVGVSGWATSPVCLALTIDGSSAPNLLAPAPSNTSPICWDYTAAVPYTSVLALDVGGNGLELECWDTAGCTGSSLGTDSVIGSGDGIGNGSTLGPVTAAGILSCGVTQLNGSVPTDGYTIDDVLYPVELQSFSVE